MSYNLFNYGIHFLMVLQNDIVLCDMMFYRLFVFHPCLNNDTFITQYHKTIRIHSRKSPLKFDVKAGNNCAVHAVLSTNFVRPAVLSVAWQISHNYCNITHPSVIQILLIMNPTRHFTIRHSISNQIPFQKDWYRSNQNKPSEAYVTINIF